MPTTNRREVPGARALKRLIEADQIQKQITGILKQHKADVSPADLCRKHGVSDASIYKWKANFGGREVSEAKRLKRLLADTMLENAALKDLWGKK